MAAFSMHKDIIHIVVWGECKRESERVRQRERERDLYIKI